MTCQLICILIVGKFIVNKQLTYCLIREGLLWISMLIPAIVFSQVVPVYDSENAGMVDSLSWLKEKQRSLIYKGDYLGAVEMGTKALRIARDVQSHESIIELNNANGVIHHKLGNDEEALRVFYEALLYEKQYPHPTYLPKILNNVGTALMQQDSLDKALMYFEKSLEVVEFSDDSTFNIAPLANIALIYFQRGEYIQSIAVQEDALKTLSLNTYNDKWSYANLCNNIAIAYLEISAYSKARMYLSRSSEVAKEIEAKDIALENYQHWAQYYEETGRPKEALRYKKLELSMSDSLLNQQITSEITQWQSRFEGLKKDHEIDMLTKERKYQEEKITRQQQIQSSLIITSLFLIAIIYLLFQSVSARKKAQRESQTEKDLSVAYLNASDGILMKADKDLQLNFINDKGAQLLGINGEQEKKSIWGILSDGHRDSKLEEDLKLLVSGDKLTPIRVRSNISDAEGNYMHFSWTITRLTKEGDEAVLFFSGHDLTEINYSVNVIKSAMIEGQELEKERIAKEIQEALGPLLSSSKLRLLEYADKVKTKEGKLFDTIGLLDKSMAELKAISQSLSASRIKNYGLIASVMESCQEMSNRTKTEINFQPYYIQGVFPTEMELSIYRIFQEITLFSIQYLKSNTVNVHLIEHTDSVLLNIFHDGKEMDHKVAETSEWTNINTRVQIAKGQLKMQHSPKQGYLFSINFPYA